MGTAPLAPAHRGKRAGDRGFSAHQRPSVATAFSTQPTLVREYPEEAIREAIVNAVAHRDYSPMALGSHIQIRMFADRLEIESPGGLYGPVTVDDLEMAQSTRNEKLMELLEYQQVHGDYLVENRGSGIDTMTAAMRRAQLEPPLFRDTRSTFSVTFKNHTLLDPATIGWLNQFADRQLSTNQRLALAYLLHNSAITNADFRRLTDAEMHTATRELRGLVDAGLVEQHGTRRWATYELVPHLRQASVRESPIETILKLARGRGEISNRDVREVLGLSKIQATRMLGQMESQGLLARVGSGRWTRYRLMDQKTVGNADG